MNKKRRLLSIVAVASLVAGIGEVASPQAQAVTFHSCKEAWNQGYGDIRVGEDGYSRHLDRDGDGIACEISKSNGQYKPRAQHTQHAQNGWVKSGDAWYYYKNGSAVRNAWVGNYWLGSDGRMVTNSWVDNNRYYVGSDGAWVKGYGNKSGWQKESGSWYYYKNGSTVRNAWAGNYWLGSDGRMVTNSWVDNNHYYVGSDGAWVKGYGNKSGWQKEGGSWYYYKNGSAVRNAWAGNYWLGSDGRMVTNSWVDNNRYYVGSDGAWIKGYGNKSGWQKEGGSWYYYKNGSAVRNAWAGNYWLGSDGRMVTNRYVDGGRYYVGNDGAWVPSLPPISDLQDE